MKSAYNQFFYLPILRARGGEIEAVSELTVAQRKCVLPIFDVFEEAPGVGRKKMPKKFAGADFPFFALIDQRIDDLVALDLPLIVDSFGFDLSVETAPGTLAYSQILRRALEDNQLIPCVGLDRWLEDNYRKTVIRLAKNASNTKTAIRIDKDSLMYDVGPGGELDNTLQEVLDDCQLDPAQCVAILDFQDLRLLDPVEASDSAVGAVQTCRRLGFGLVSIGGGSFPPSVSDAVKSHWEKGYVLRIETEVFADVLDACGPECLGFTDYGVRNPKIFDGGGSNANGKIRYAVPGAHMVFRGECLFGDKRTGRVGYGFRQMHQLAEEVLSSSDCTPIRGCWGDREVERKAREHKKPGNLTDWISIDTNRHLCAVQKEVTDSIRTARRVASSAEENEAEVSVEYKSAVPHSTTFK